MQRFQTIPANASERLSTAVRRLARREGHGSGVYLVVDRRALAQRQGNLVTRAMNEPRSILYVGSGTLLRSRVRSLFRSLTGNPRAHGFGQKLRDRCPGPSPSDLVLVLVPFAPAWCLEKFLLQEISRKAGARPPFNDRPAGRTSARKRLPAVNVSWQMLGLNPKLEG
jgi:hypothetical protein